MKTILAATAALLIGCLHAADSSSVLTATGTSSLMLQTAGIDWNPAPLKYVVSKAASVDVQHAERYAVVRAHGDILVVLKPETIFWTKPEGSSMRDHSPHLVIPGGFDMVKVGDVTSAIIPEGPHAGELYGHVVTEILADGSYRTSGDAPGAVPDPWLVTRELHAGREIRPSSIAARDVWAVGLNL